MGVLFASPFLWFPRRCQRDGFFPESEETHLTTARHKIEDTLTRRLHHEPVLDADAEDFVSQLIQRVLAALPFNHLADLSAKSQELLRQVLVELRRGPQ